MPKQPCRPNPLRTAGVSNVMAAHTISLNRKEYNEDGSYAAAAGAGAAQPKRLLYSYFTAGAAA